MYTKLVNLLLYIFVCTACFLGKFVNVGLVFLLHWKLKYAFTLKFCILLCFVAHYCSMRDTRVYIRCGKFSSH